MRAPKEHVDSIVSNAQWRHPALHAAAIEMVRRAMLEAAEAGALAMQEWLAESVPYLIEGDIAQDILRGAIQSVNPVAIARRVVDAEGGQ